MHIARIVAATAVSIACIPFTPTARALGLQDTYVVDADSGVPGVPRMPEGVAFDPVLNDFYATALVGGRITRVDAFSGEETTFYQEQDNPALSFAGIKIAPMRRVAWVCAADLTTDPVLPQSEVVALRIPLSGEAHVIRRFALPAPFFCNDLALDWAGNAYVTNSAGASVMKISARGLWDRDVEAEVFATSAALAPDPTSPSPAPFMNGITVTPDGRYLIVAHGAPAALYRIPFDAPDEVVPLAFSGDLFGSSTEPGVNPLRYAAPDGIVFVGGALYVVYAGALQRVEFEPGSAYLAGHVSSRTDVSFGLTTATRAWGQLYVIDAEIQARFPELGIPVELPHEILRIDPCAF